MKHAKKIAVFIIVSAPMLWGATVITNYNSNLHDRFDSTSFIASSFDLSGIARSSDGDGRWATMLTPDYFISANHFRPSINSTLTFHLDNSSTGATETRTVESGVRIGNTDLWVGKLNTPVPGSVATYQMATGTLNLSSSLGPYADELVYQVGLRGLKGTSGTTNFVVGLNNIDIGDSTSVALGTFGTVGYIQDISGPPNDTNLNDPGETFLQDGDSGAPSFIVDGGELRLVGIHAYILENLPENASNFGDFVESQSPNSAFSRGGIQTRSVSYDTFVPNYNSDILAVIPEISSVYMMALVIIPVAILFHKRR